MTMVGRAQLAWGSHVAKEIRRLPRRDVPRDGGGKSPHGSWLFLIVSIL